MKFFDSHIHLHSFKEEGWEKETEWVFNNIPLTLSDCLVVIEQARNNKHVYATLGVHPYEIVKDELSVAMDVLDKKIAANKDKVIAIGETGLDFYRGDKDQVFENQKKWLLAHYELAKKYDLPLIIHVRRAHEELLEILNTEIHWRGVIHCYEGPEEIVKRYLELPEEWMISVSPTIFREKSEFKHYINKMDLNRLLVETDAPYQAKSYDTVKELMEIIAKQKDITFEECAKALWKNASRFFGIELE